MVFPMKFGHELVMVPTKFPLDRFWICCVWNILESKAETGHPLSWKILEARKNPKHIDLFGIIPSATRTTPEQQFKTSSKGINSCRDLQSSILVPCNALNHVACVLPQQQHLDSTRHCPPENQSIEGRSSPNPPCRTSIEHVHDYVQTPNRKRNVKCTAICTNHFMPCTEKAA